MLAQVQARSGNLAGSRFSFRAAFLEKHFATEKLKKTNKQNVNKKAIIKFSWNRLISDSELSFCSLVDLVKGGAVTLGILLLCYVRHGLSLSWNALFRLLAQGDLAGQVCHEAQ